MGFTVHKEPKDPFEPHELAKLFGITPQQLKDAYPYGRYKVEDADQTIVFALMQRYTGMDVSTLTFLEKSRVRGIE